MKKTSRIRIVLILTPLLAGIAAPSVSGEDLKDLATRFFQNPFFSGLTLSPDGSHFAFYQYREIPANPYYENQRYLSTFTVANNEIRSYLGLQGQGVHTYDWVDDDTIIFEFFERFSHSIPGREEIATLATADEGMTEVFPLMEMSMFSLLSGVRKRPGEALVYNTKQGRKFDDIRCLNVKNQTWELDTENPGRVVSWLADDDGIVRLGQVLTENSGFHWLHRFNAESTWERLDLPDQSMPLAFDSTGTTLYVCHSEGRDVDALFVYDLKKKRFLGESYSDPGYDVCENASGLIRDQKHNAVVGFRYLRDKPVTVYFDEDYRNLQSKINQALPGSDNQILGLTEKGYIVIRVESDVISPTCYLLNPKTGGLAPFLPSRKWISNDELSPIRPVSFVSRDGATIHGYLTLPKRAGKGPYPLVLDIHGGPQVRDTWGFDSAAQFFAQLGYAHYRVNYRGSTGYGDTYEGDNILQVCRYVIDDVADAARWAIAEGHADPDRIAIFGGSFGGYAALAGAAFEPELYRCAIGFAGVYDWIVQLKEDRKDWWMRYLVFDSKGDYYLDIEENKEAYRALSPRYAAEKIRAPILLIHGGADRRVAAHQAKVMRGALRSAKKTHEVAISSWQPHGFYGAESRTKFYIRVAEFLEKHMR